MGRYGPAPTPVAAKLARGETRPSRVNYESPQPRSEPPRMPADMEDSAKLVWKRVLAAMAGTGIITAADADVLRVYCEAVARYQRAVGMLARSTPLLAVSRRRGEVVRNPLNAIVRDLADQIRLYARELGLSPSARAGLRLDAGHQEAELDAIIGPPPRLRAVK